MEAKYLIHFKYFTQLLVSNFTSTYLYNILIPDIFTHLGGASGRMSASGLSRHSKPGAHTPQKKLVDGLKQSPHDSPSCLVSFSKSFKINCNVHYRIRRYNLKNIRTVIEHPVCQSTQLNTSARCICNLVVMFALQPLLTISHCVGWWAVTRATGFSKLTIGWYCWRQYSWIC